MARVGAPASVTHSVNGLFVLLLPLQVSAVGSPVTVDRIRLQAGGPGNETNALQALVLLLDRNGNGVPDAADRILSERTTLNADDGMVELVLQGATVREDTAQTWFVMGLTRHGVTETVRLDLLQAVDVQARHLFPPAVVTPTGTFPILGDTVSLEPGPTVLQRWLEARFLPAELLDPLLSGPGADFDGDGIPNFVEYSLGLDPKVKDSLDERIQVREQYDLIEYRYRRSVTEYLTFRPLVSDNVGSWNDVSHLLHATRIIDHYDGTETVVLQIL